jgi:hypothetical protein
LALTLLLKVRFLDAVFRLDRDFPEDVFDNIKSVEAYLRLEFLLLEDFFVFFLVDLCLVLVVTFLFPHLFVAYF